MTDIELMKRFQIIQDNNNRAIELAKIEQEAMLREMESYANITRKLTAKDILQRLADSFECIEQDGCVGMFVFSEVVFALAKEYGVKLDERN